VTSAGPNLDLNIKNYLNKTITAVIAACLKRLNQSSSGITLGTYSFECSWIFRFVGNFKSTEVIT
jgi:hypothetical protein